MNSLADLLAARGIPAAGNSAQGAKSQPGHGAPQAAGPILHDCVQGTTEWLELRAGIPTASNFKKILTPGGKISDQAEKYLWRLLAERLLGRPLDEEYQFNSEAMKKGSETEAEAVKYYEFQKDVETQAVGFVTNADRTIGCSPDRFVGDRGMAQFKCPKPETHVGYLLKKAVDAEYYPQVQGELWIAEREWNDVVSYFKDMPSVMIRVERDEKYITKLDAAVTTFSLELERQWSLMVERGWAPKQKAPKAPSTHDDLRAVAKEILLAAQKGTP